MLWARSPESIGITLKTDESGTHTFTYEDSSPFELTFTMKVPSESGNEETVNADIDHTNIQHILTQSLIVREAALTTVGAEGATQPC